MKRLIKLSAYFLGLIATASFGSCSDDIDPEITEINVSRLFSPVDLEVRIINQTSARLSWKAVNKATSYTVEFFQNENSDIEEPEFSGSPTKTVEGITYSQLPYTVPGFAGETTYSVRVKAVGESILESKWIEALFTTGTEQILSAIQPDDIGATTFILRWPAGEVATSVVLFDGTNELTFEVTQEHIEAGEITLTGLNSETGYFLRLVNNGSTRGTHNFTTLIDIGDAILVEPGDNLKEIIEAAEEGDVFALMPGEYQVDANIHISKTIGIIAVRPFEKPVINGVVFRISGGAGFRLKDLILDGETAPDGNQTIIYDEVLGAGETYGNAIIEGCEIKNYVKGVFYASNAVLIESVSITGTIYSDIVTEGGDFIDFRNGMTKVFDFKNNTVYNSVVNRDVIRMDNAAAFSGDNTAIITIENNTFYNVITQEGSTRRILYVRLANHEIYVRKNIFANIVGTYSNQSATTVVGMDGNNYFNAPNLTNDEITVYDRWNYTELNPGFADPENGNFTISNEDLIFYRIGDPRWIP
ncbi:DUF4957 domain-containing protein [Natronoflexus pectinivorans]|uniref:Uncharacterized protein DUF5123 n=1 Tax=Natronoflexus pectinivorans TaxID=682526 RepID=A0A4R2G7V9_9BACT|nr:DUF4957 domain-containing protein [Natronoflexus pectinivorans]TCO03631.1 uncharacterized protein DUF5123 [Natronoflexus pectinivorans]